MIVLLCYIVVWQVSFKIGDVRYVGQKFVLSCKLYMYVLDAFVIPPYQILWIFGAVARRCLLLIQAKYDNASMILYLLILTQFCFLVTSSILHSIFSFI